MKWRKGIRTKKDRGLTGIGVFLHLCLKPENLIACPQGASASGSLCCHNGISLSSMFFKNVWRRRVSKPQRAIARAVGPGKIRGGDRGREDREEERNKKVSD